MMNENRPTGKKDKREDDDGNAAVLPLLRIQDVYPGSRIRIFSIPDPGPKIFPDLDPH
jgi:hypothetical protein